MARWQQLPYEILQALLLLILGLHMSRRYAYAGNITVDDANSNLLYSSAWRVGQTCTVCLLHPDPNYVYDRTWHDTTRIGSDPVTVNYTFKGTDLYVYGIMSNVVNDIIISNVNLILNIDGVDIAAFAFQPLNLNSYSYNTNVFAIHGLSDVSHRMSIALQPRSQFHFDYLIYTTGGGNEMQPSPTNSSGSSAPVITGAVAGGVLLILIISVIVFFYIRRKRKISIIAETVPPVPTFIADPYRSASSGGGSHLPQPNHIQPNAYYHRNLQGMESRYTTSETNVYNGIEAPAMGGGQVQSSIERSNQARPTSQNSPWAAVLGTDPAYIPPRKSAVSQQQQQLYVDETIHSAPVPTDIAEGVSINQAPSPVRRSGEAIDGATRLLSDARSLEGKEDRLDPRMTGSLDPSVYTTTKQTPSGLQEKTTDTGPLPTLPNGDEGYNDAMMLRAVPTGSSPPSYYAGPSQ